MSVALSAVTRERLRRFMRVMRIAAAIGAGFGAVYAGVTASPGARSLLVALLISIPISVIDAVLTASWIAGIEIFLLPRASMRWLDALPFAAVLGNGHPYRDHSGIRTYSTLRAPGRRQSV